MSMLLIMESSCSEYFQVQSEQTFHFFEKDAANELQDFVHVHCIFINLVFIKIPECRKCMWT